MSKSTTYRPSEDDHAVFGSRLIQDPTQSLPETTKEEIQSKISAEQKTIDQIREVADADMLGDDTDQSVFKTYRGNGPKDKIVVQVREKTVDATLRQKASAIERDLATLKDKLAAFDTISQEIKDNQKLSEGSYNENIYASTIRPARAYLASVRKSKKSGRRGKTARKSIISTGKA